LLRVFLGMFGESRLLPGRLGLLLMFPGGLTGETSPLSGFFECGLARFLVLPAQLLKLVVVRLRGLAGDVSAFSGFRRGLFRRTVRFLGVLAPLLGKLQLMLVIPGGFRGDPGPFLGFRRRALCLLPGLLGAGMLLPRLLRSHPRDLRLLLPRSFGLLLPSLLGLLPLSLGLLLSRSLGLLLPRLLGLLPLSFGLLLSRSLGLLLPSLLSLLLPRSLGLLLPSLLSLLLSRSLGLLLPQDLYL
jgi:hypothetical protein